MKLTVKAWMGAALAAGGLALAPAVLGEEAPPSEATRAAIAEALNDEYRGEAIYSRVLSDHGEIRPFSQVVHGETRHAALLEGLLRSRGLALPENRWSAAEVTSYETVGAACVAAVEWEARNVALYDRLLANETLPRDVRSVFEHNRSASLEHHKPAFERCGGRTLTPRMSTPRGGCDGCGHHGCRGHGCGHRGCGHHGCGPCGDGDCRGTSGP